MASVGWRTQGRPGHGVLSWKGRTMESAARKISPAVFVLALICFFLPFVSFSCQGMKVASFSGIQLVTGTTLQQPQMFGPPTAQKVGAEPLAVLTFLCGIAGLGLSFLKGRNSGIGPILAGGLAAIFLLALKSKLESDALKQGGGAIQVQFAAGYWVVLVFFLAAVALNAFPLVQGKRIAPPVGPSGARLGRTPSAPTDLGDKFCSQCGARTSPTDFFCKQCGAKAA